jgi:hypothetical protein
MIEVSSVGLGVDLILGDPLGFVDSPEGDPMFHDADGSINVLSCFWREGIPFSFVEEGIRLNDLRSWGVFPMEIERL